MDKMDFYRINEEYNRFLQRYEKEKRGVTKVPNIRYTDRNKFAFGAVMQVNGMNYYVSVSSFDKKQAAREVVAVEIDKALIPILQDTLSEFPNAEVIQDDILKVDIAELARKRNGGRPIKVVANLPYYITTPIIMNLFESHVPLASVTVMVQKEVAERMQAGPGSKDYGALSLAVQYYAAPYIAANVPPNCFMPRPNVGSAVIRLTRHEVPPVQTQNEKLMFRIIRASFNQRRKTLVNGLNNSPEIHLEKDKITEAVERLGKGVGVRGEALTLEEFARLADMIDQMT